MNKRTAIIAALCVILAAVSAPTRSQQLRESRQQPTGDVWPNASEETRTPLRPATSFNADDLGPLPGSAVAPTEEVGREPQKTSPSRIEVDITLTMGPIHVASGRHRSFRSCR
jgi:hypothetical protein